VAAAASAVPFKCFTANALAGDEAVVVVVGIPCSAAVIIRVRMMMRLSAAGARTTVAAIAGGRD